MRANEKDIAHLKELYEGRTLIYGDLHNHGATGGTSDGKRPLSHWLGALEALNMDFVSILDHKQVRHMYLPEWDDTVFIGGSEPGTMITDIDAKNKGMHYNMIFSTAEPLMQLLSEFPEFKFEGGREGHFIYPSFTKARFTELVKAVLLKGGFFVHPHPKQVMDSQNPEDYWFSDETGIEVFYGDMRNIHTEANYKLWCDLLAMGKRIFVCAGEDGHLCARDTALTSIFTEDRHSATLISHLRRGDFVCGSVAMRMCVGETKMGGKCSFNGERLVLAIGDDEVYDRNSQRPVSKGSVGGFHKSIANPEHKYRVEILDDKGRIFSEEIECGEFAFFAIDTSSDAAFYRAEVYDANTNLRIAIGNPIWNDK